MTNTFKTNEAAETELARRKEESSIIYKGDSVYSTKGEFFVGTYHEYKRIMDI